VNPSALKELSTRTPPLNWKRCKKSLHFVVRKNN
jgi:hypothetical protein